MADTKNVYQRLLAVQQEAKAPREINGKFGNARSAEQILESYKPACNKHGLYLQTTDKMHQVGDRNYVTATARVVNVDDPTEFVEADASAWENVVEVNKYGAAILDTSQVTGKTSSYAKKYALQNLFAIDDTKDADNDHDFKPPAPQADPAPLVVKAGTAVGDELTRAKGAINDALEENGYTTVVAKKAYIVKELGHSTIETLEEANVIADSLGME